MKLPIRFILVYGIQGVNPFIIKLEAIPVTDVLQLGISFHVFTSNLTPSIAKSFQANDSNEEYFKALAIKHIFGTTLSLADAELLNLHIQQNYIVPYQNNVNSILSISTKWFNFAAYYSNVYSFQNFLQSFIHNYMYLSSEYSKLKQSQIKPEIKSSPQITTPTIEVETINKPSYEEPSEEIEIIYDNVNIDSLTLINDSIQFSPNNLTKFFIGKYLQLYLNNVYVESEFNIINHNGTLVITINPLIDTTLISLSKTHYKQLFHILESFDIHKDELLHKIRSILNQLIYIIRLYLTDNNKKELITLPLKILEFLMFIYGCKYQQVTMAPYISKESSDPLSFHKNMLDIVNYFIKYILDTIDKSSLQYQNIYFQHPFYSSLTNKIEDTSTLEQILTKERYLLDIDKTSFINNIYNQLKNNTNTSKNVKLILNNPTIITLDSFIDKGTPESAWLSYSTITSNNRLKNHTILTKEYFQLLTLAISDNPQSVLPLIQNEMNPILLRHYETIMNVIFKELISTVTDLNNISTLNILTHHIRPFLNNDSSIETEMFILYKCIIPYLYDVYKINSFIDYFH